MRVYVPVTTRVLRRLVDTGELGPPPLTAFAVTPELREWYTSGDLDELEYAALMEAARGSLRLLDEDPTSARRRGVIAADVPDGQVDVRSDLDRAVVRVTAAIPMREVAALHMDGAQAEEVVAAAAAAILEADLGGEDAKFLVDEAEGQELLWFASQEVGSLLDLL